MAEAWGDHRRQLESNEQGAFLKSRTRGQWFGFLIVMGAIFSGTLLALNDKPAWGLGIMLGSIAIIVGAFVLGRDGGQLDIQGAPPGTPMPPDDRDSPALDGDHDTPR